MKIYHITRMLGTLWKRICNQYFTYYNRIKFNVLGVRIGKHFIVHGSVRVSLGKNANIEIGDNFCFLSGRTLNPLSRDRKSVV